MRGVAGLVLGALALLALTGCEAPERGGSGLPQRAPGLWRQVVVADGRTQRLDMCLDAAAARRLNLLGEEPAKFDCETDRAWREGEGWAFESRCDMLSYGRQATSGRVSGDFSRRYVMQAVTVTEGARMPQANGRHVTRIEAEHAGPCPAGMRPGEVRLDDGKRFNVLNTRPMR